MTSGGRIVGKCVGLWDRSTGYQLEAMIKGRALRIEWEGTESSRFKVQCLRSETI